MCCSTHSVVCSNVGAGHRLGSGVDVGGGGCGSGTHHTQRGLGHGLCCSLSCRAMTSVEPGPLIPAVSAEVSLGRSYCAGEAKERNGKKTHFYVRRLYSGYTVDSKGDYEMGSVQCLPLGFMTMWQKWPVKDQLRLNGKNLYKALLSRSGDLMGSHGIISPFNKNIAAFNCLVFVYSLITFQRKTH